MTLASHPSRARHIWLQISIPNIDFFFIAPRRIFTRWLISLTIVECTQQNARLLIGFHTGRRQYLNVTTLFHLYNTQPEITIYMP